MNDKIINFINKIFRNDNITKYICKVTQAQIEDIEIKITDIKKNMFLNGATWGIDIFEKELNIEYTEDKTIDERKAIISAKWRGSGKLTLELIRDTVKAYTTNVVNVHFNGTIVIDFSDKIGMPSDIKSLMNSIEEIKPAHLGVDYIFKFRTWGELKQFNWARLNNFTWQKVKESEELNERF